MLVSAYHKQARSRLTASFILEAARGLLSGSVGRGARVTLRDIADRAGVALSTLSDRFPSREALLAQLWTADMQAQAVVLADELQRIEAADAPAEVRARMREGMKHYLAGVRTRSVFLTVLGRELAQSPRLARLRSRSVRRQREVVEASLAKALGARWTPALRLRVRRGLHALYAFGLASRDQVMIETIHGPNADLERIGDELVGLLLDYMLGPVAERARLD